MTRAFFHTGSYRRVPVPNLCARLGVRAPIYLNRGTEFGTPGQDDSPLWVGQVEATYATTQ